MTLKRYQTLRRNLHTNDNTENYNEQNLNDKLFKVLPLLELVKKNRIKIDPKQCHSLDYQIIPAKTKSSDGVKQQIQKWGFKNMVRVGQPGFINDFFMYGGEK